MICGCQGKTLWSGTVKTMGHLGVRYCEIWGGFSPRGAEDIGGLTARKTKKESKHNYIISCFQKACYQIFGKR